MFACLDRVLSPEFGGCVETLPHAAVAATAAAGVGFGRVRRSSTFKVCACCLSDAKDLARLLKLARDTHGGELLKTACSSGNGLTCRGAWICSWAGSAQDNWRFRRRARGPSCSVRRTARERQFRGPTQTSRQYRLGGIRSCTSGEREKYGARRMIAPISAQITP